MTWLQHLKSEEGYSTSIVKRRDSGSYVLIIHPVSLLSYGVTSTTPAGKKHVRKDIVLRHPGKALL